MKTYLSSCGVENIFENIYMRDSEIVFEKVALEEWPQKLQVVKMTIVRIS